MPLNIPSNSNSLDFNEVNNTIYSSIRTQENDLRISLATIKADADGNVSQADLLVLQQRIQQWAALVDLQASLSKLISDSLKSVIQKST